MNIKVPYGKGYQEAVVDDSLSVQIVDPVCEKVTATPAELIEKALDNPIGTPRLETMVTPEDHITIIVNDHTRPGPNAQIVDAIMKRLDKAGLPRDNVQFVIATGSHRASTPAELDTILGEQYSRTMKVHLHDCQDGDHVYMGECSYGMPIWVDRRVAEASFIITTGLIAPHHAAGFSGGRKSIVPGVAGIETLHIHHSLPIRQYEPAMGFFEENPFHLAALEAAKKVNVRFIVNVVQDTVKQNVDCVAGDLSAAHEAGVAICRAHNTVRVSGLADVVVTSPGGSPRDCNLYQAQKALSVAEVFGRKGACTFILCARAEDGIGEGLFQQWLTEASDPQEVVDRFRKEGYNVGNNKAFMYARAMLKGRVIIVSDQVDPKVLKEMMLDSAPTLQEALDRVIAEKRPEKIIVLPKAVSLIPKVTE